MSHYVFRIIAAFILAQSAVVVSVCGQTKALGVESDRARLQIQLGHARRPSSLSFSPDGSLAVTASADDRNAVLWDLVSGRELRVFSGSTGGIVAVVFSHDGNHVLTGSDDMDRSARLWDVRSGREIHRFQGHAGSVESVAFSIDGKSVLTGSSADSAVLMWDTASGREMRRFSAHPDGVFSVAFSPDGNYVLTGGGDKNPTAQLWDVKNGRQVRNFEGHSSRIVSVAFSPDGRSILTGSSDLTARLWDVASGREINRFDGHPNFSYPVGFSVDGETLLIGTTARRLNRVTGPETRVFDATARTSALSPDGRQVLTDDLDGSVRLWDVASGNEIRRLKGNAYPIESMAVSVDGQYLLTGGVDPAARLWDMVSGREVRSFRGVSDVVISVAFAPDGLSLLTGGSGDIAQLWDPASGNEQRRLKRNWGMLLSSAFSPDSKRLLTGSYDSTARLWDLASGAEIQSFKGSSAWISSVAFSPDGSLVLTGGSGKYAELWNVSTGKEIRAFQGHTDAAHSVAFSQNGKQVLTGSWDHSARLWDVESGAEIRRLEGHSGRIVAVAFSPDPDSRFVLTGSDDTTVRLWDTSSGREMRALRGSASSIWSVGFTRGGKQIVSTSADGTTRFWDTESGAEIATLVSFRGRGWAISRPDGRFDTSQLDGTAAMSWIVDDQPLHPLPSEIFMRDYYEPGLLPRLLGCSDAKLSNPQACATEFKPIRPLASLNRVQPEVEVKADWVDASAGVARVTVKVGRQSDPEMRNGKTATDPYDVRLFRDGQLVGWGPKTSVDWQLMPAPAGPKADELDLKRWRDKTHIALETDGTKELPPFRVQVPRRTDLKQVTFTAYAFNEDRVKSSTASATLAVDKPLKPHAGKAYVISVGVNRTESSPAWDLQYAANDARRMSEVVGNKLEGTKQFSEVVRIRLVSDAVGKQEAGEAAATKAHVQAVLDVLAGRRAADEQLKRDIPGIEEVEKAQPEDLVLLAFSSHGYTDDRGVFHMVLADIGRHTPQDKITPELQNNSLSSDVLSGWLREVDAGEMVMVVDSCHSEATVAAEGFKPGPMGSRGLGQLAYDKGMRILAASKSKESAVERGGGIDDGLLSYALVHEGLEQGLADFQPQDGKILMSEWLIYGEQEVPKLFAEGNSKGVIQRKGAPDTEKEIYLGGKRTPSTYQQPVLFDFNKEETDILLSTALSGVK